MAADTFFAPVEHHPDKRFDFIDGELVEVSPKPLHGYLQAKLIMLLGHWLAENPVRYAVARGAAAQSASLSRPGDPGCAAHPTR
jgi:Uma2 family endonuclease